MKLHRGHLSFRFTPPATGAGSELHLKPLGLELLLASAWRAWAAVSLLALVCGLLWRVLGDPPPLARCVDGLGAGLWLTAYLLAPGWAAMLERQRLSAVAGSSRLLLKLLNSLLLTGVALLIALAAGGVLLAYNPLTPLCQVITLDAQPFDLPAGAVLLLVLISGGTVLLLLSLQLLMLLTRLAGSEYGTLLWLGLGTAANLHLLTGGIMGWFWTRLSSYAYWMVVQFAEAAGRSQYLIEVVQIILAVSLGMLCGAAVLLALGQFLSWRQPSPVRLLWLAASAALLVSALRVICLSYAWEHTSSLSYPGDWRQVFFTGLAVFSLMLALGSGQLRPLRRQPAALELGWVAACSVILTLLTLPNLIADQVGRLDVLRLAGCTLIALLACGGLLLRCGFSQLPALPRLLALLLICALTSVPLSGALPPALAGLLDDTAAALGDAERLQQGLSVLAVLAVAALLLWPLQPPKRLRRRPGSTALH